MANASASGIARRNRHPPPSSMTSPNMNPNEIEFALGSVPREVIASVVKKNIDQMPSGNEVKTAATLFQ
jgi:hypothetical protein